MTMGLKMEALQPSSDAPDFSAMSSVPLSTLSHAVLTAYRDSFKLALSEGRARPLVIPFCLAAPFIAPTLWLAVPHRRRRWFYSTRWLVMAFIIWSNVDHILYASSTNIAFSYGAGLASTFGTMLSMNLLIWTRPQFDAARTLKVRKTELRSKKNVSAETEDENLQRQANGNGNGTVHENGNGNGLRQRTSAATTPKDHAALHEDEEFEYIWEPYPADGTFLERLAWSMDLIFCFRCAGWNWSVPSIPRPKIPLKIHDGNLVDIESIPEVSRSGYKRYTTEGEFVRDRLFKVVTLYLVLDILSVLMMKDPYFILGPDHHNYNLPLHLQQLPTFVLNIYRQLFTLTAVYAAIEAIFGVSDLVQYWLANRFFPSRGALWQYCSSFGSFDQILDRGLGGWWGSWWHQTFRIQFLAPATYLMREGYMTKGTQLSATVAMFISFTQSGLLHASGSLTSLPKTKPWRSPLFFFLQGVGILLQQGLAQLIRRFIPHPPRGLARAVNLLFTLAWLYFTAGLFVDDCASAGLWLLEPVPISPMRFFGLGHPGDHWWRWDRDSMPRVYIGESWWRSGFAM